MTVMVSIAGEPQGKARARVVWDWSLPGRILEGLRTAIRRLPGESGGLERRNSRMRVTKGRKHKNDQETRYSRLPGVAGDAKPGG